MPYQEQRNTAQNKTWAFFTGALLIVCFMLSAVIPPLQSPDEIDHIKRAYLLTKGVIKLQTPPGASSGGMIDTGLFAYLKLHTKFIGRSERKLSEDFTDEANHIKWTGIESFSSAPGTGYYFPIIYAPQAIGLAIGKSLDLTVDTSYRMARMSTLITSMLFVSLAFWIYRPPLLAAALLILPMSLFQFASASLDGISTAIFILAVSCFCRIASDKENSPKYLIYILIACTAIITSSRVHALPMFLLTAFSLYYYRDKKPYILSTFSLALVLVWTAVAMKSTLNLQTQNTTPTTSIISYYIESPTSFARVLYHTIADPTTIQFYLESFVGILGWLDTRLSSWSYSVIYVLMAVLFAISILGSELKRTWRYSLILSFSAVFSIILIFLALLITWNAKDHPALKILGIQGRYFLLPALLIAYAFSTGKETRPWYAQHIGNICLLALLLFCAYATSSILINRYYLTEEQQITIHAELSATAPLAPSQPIKLNLRPDFSTSPPQLHSVSIRFGTHMRINSGVAELRLTGKDGLHLTVPFDLPTLSDNAYKTIELDDQQYSSAEISYGTGGGVSVWQATTPDGTTNSCIIYKLSNGVTRYTSGCPRP